MTNTNLSLTKFQQLLAAARAKSQARKDEESVVSITAIQHRVEEQQPESVDLSNLGITDESLEGEEGRERAIETLQEVVSNPGDTGNQNKIRITGVAADVELNERQ